MLYTCDLDHVVSHLQIGDCTALYEQIEKDIHSLVPYLDLKGSGLPEQLLQNEKTHSFSAGNGVAIANAVIPRLERPYHMFYKLNHKIAFNTMDNQNVDLVFVLLSPEADGPLHLRRLSRLTRLMQDETFQQTLRNINDNEALKGQFRYPVLSSEAA